jgi:hypothetical protein
MDQLRRFTFSEFLRLRFLESINARVAFPGEQTTGPDDRSQPIQSAQIVICARDYAA